MSLIPFEYMEDGVGVAMCLDEKSCAWSYPVAAAELAFPSSLQETGATYHRSEELSYKLLGVE